MPALTTAIGMALLARFDDDTVRALHRPVLHYPVTDLTTRFDDLLTQVREVRAQRWTMATGTTFPGFGAVGVAVGGMHGHAGYRLLPVLPNRHRLRRADQRPRSLPDGASGRDDRIHYDVRL
ncbi:MAG: IclR family transcriptional regulator C-terminal domain-containing protein [Pseudomonadota bacterium]|nr:IclR family transcriptional regulator C-terminal domain-containing protein [Pseudomonadota bacterium]